MKKSYLLLIQTLFFGFLLACLPSGAYAGTFGSGLEVPFVETFNTEEDLAQWKIEDANADSNTWKYFPKNGVGDSGCVGYSSSSKVADDWIFSKGIKLRPGALYKLTYKIRMSSYTSADGHLQVTLNTSASSTGVKTELNKHENYNNTSWKTFTVEVEVDEEKDYNLGFHVYSPSDNKSLFLDDVSLELVYVKTAPKAISNLSIVPALLGVLSADLEFTAPLLANDGNNLSGTMDINIYRNDSSTVADVLSGVTPGQTLTWTDTNPVNGFNTYTIVAANASGEGTAVSSRAYVGIDSPVAISDLKAQKIGDDKFELTWEASSVVGKNGGYVNLDSVQYMIGVNGTLIAVADTTSFFNTITVPEGKQGYFQFQVQPYNAYGLGTQSTSNLLNYGTPYALPYTESFAGGKITTPQWGIDFREVVGSVEPKWSMIGSLGYPYNVTPQDNDLGFASFNSSDCSAGSTLSFLSPGVSIKGVSNPTLSFYFYHYTHSFIKDVLQVQISADDAEFEDLAGAKIDLRSSTEGWALYEFPLTDYVGKDKITIAFKGISSNGFPISIDNIIVENNYNYNLEVVSALASKYVIAGDTATFSVDVKNNAKATVNEGDYKVVLYKDGAEFLTQDGVELAWRESKNVSFEILTTIDDANKSYRYHAEIAFDLDENLADNISDTIIINVQQPTFPQVEDLALDSLVNNNVTLTWSEPEYPKTKQEYFDDFESYDSFIIDNIGDWTVVDLDGGATYAPNGTEEGAYPNVYAKMAFQVYSPKEVDAEIAASQSYKAHSGDKYIIAWGTPENSYDPEGAAPNDDWLISPELSGYGETLSFFAKAIVATYGAEKFQVLYSNTDKNPASFIKLNAAENEEVLATWTEFTYQIPFKAKYFAIRYVSNDVYGLMIDDIKYTSESLEIVGYNVYRDGVKVTETPLTECSYVDTLLEGETASYTVSVVYDKGESYYSDVVEVDNALGVFDDSSSLVKVTLADNTISIEGAEGLNVSVSSLDGRVLLNTKATASELVINVDAGVYVVKVGNKTFKVMNR